MASGLHCIRNASREQYMPVNIWVCEVMVTSRIQALLMVLFIASTLVCPSGGMQGPKSHVLGHSLLKPMFREISAIRSLQYLHEFGTSDRVMRLRGSGSEEPQELASQCWEMLTGQGKEPCEEFIFTVLRNKKTRAAIELVHDDDEVCMGFFRFMTSDMFDFVPESPLFANFSDDCPGYATFVNGHFTGDFIQSRHLYKQLADNIGAQLIPLESFPICNWTCTAMDGGKYLILQHTFSGCAWARIILTADGFSYFGCNDTIGWLRNPPNAIFVEGFEKPRREELAVARARFPEHVLPPLQDSQAEPEDMPTVQSLGDGQRQVERKGVKNSGEEDINCDSSPTTDEKEDRSEGG